MKVYLSGPITGKEDGNKAVFAGCKKALEQAGWEVITPYDTNPPEQEAAEEANREAGKLYTESYWKLLSKDVLTVSEVEGIIFLPEWEKSTGARVEAYIGLVRGLPIWDFEDILDTGEVQLTELKPSYVAGICVGQWVPIETLRKYGLAA